MNRRIKTTLNATLFLVLSMSMPLVSGPSFASMPTATQTHYNIHGESIDLYQLFPDYKSRCFFLNSKLTTDNLVSPGSDLLSVLNSVPTIGSYLLDTATALSPAICVENRTDGTHGYYDYKYNALVVQDSMDVYERSISLVHELRHVEQVINNFGVYTDYDISEIARLRFAVEADAQAIATLFAWQLKVHGVVTAWKSLKNLYQYRDITQAFENEMYSSGQETAALLAAFRQWYQSAWRTDAYHNSAHSGYLDLLDETKHIRQYSDLPSDFFDDLCGLPNGDNYGCHLSTEISLKTSVIKELARENEKLSFYKQSDPRNKTGDSSHKRTISPGSIQDVLPLKSTFVGNISKISSPDIVLSGSTRHRQIGVAHQFPAKY